MCVGLCHIDRPDSCSEFFAHNNWWNRIKMKEMLGGILSDGPCVHDKNDEIIIELTYSFWNNNTNWFILW